MVEGEIRSCLSVVGEGLDSGGRGCGRAGYGHCQAYDSDRLGEGLGVVGGLVGAACGWVYLEGLVIGGGDGA